MRRSMSLFVSFLLAGSAGLASQDAPTPLCYHARPRPACSAFAFTNFGGYAILGGDASEGTPLREVADWGAMVNVGRRDAIGVSVFASLDRIGLTVGPAVRYRRWLPSGGALEVAVGTPVVRSSQNTESGSVFGLARWSPNDWLALAVRPEVLRQSTVVGCGPVGCSYAVRSHTRVSVGMELGRVPGAVLTALGAAAGYLLALAAVAD